MTPTPELEAAAEAVFLELVACMGWHLAQRDPLWADDVDRAYRYAAKALAAADRVRTDAEDAGQVKTFPESEAA